MKQTCQQLRTRLMEFGYQMLKEEGDAWCKSQGIDFWNYSAKQGGWAAKTKANGRTAMVWQFLVQLAFTQARQPRGGLHRARSAAARCRCRR